MKLYNSSCFDVFPTLDDNSVDMVCVDPPYGTTSIEWDSVLDFSEMWKGLNRVVKPNGNIIIFGSQPFSSLLICSNIKHFKYELVWNKNKCGSPGLAKKRPQKIHENIMIFQRDSKGATYNPIMESGDAYKRKSTNKDKDGNLVGYGSGKNTHGYGFGKEKMMESNNSGTRYPKSILHASRNFSAQQQVHPTQKPTNLLNWLIMTYSNPNDTILDFTMGSGSCGVSAKLTGRKFIGIELNKKYYDIAVSKIGESKENSISTKDHQLTTQISKEMKTK
jgi:site-specific DNA-methyltransferase (adenine-specific)